MPVHSAIRVKSKLHSLLVISDISSKISYWVGLHYDIKLLFNPLIFYFMFSFLCVDNVYHKTTFDDFPLSLLPPTTKIRTL